MFTQGSAFTLSKQFLVIDTIWSQIWHKIQNPGKQTICKKIKGEEATIHYRAGT